MTLSLTAIAQDSVLQWSRGVIAAEMSPAIAYCVPSILLQWSRGVIAAEIGRRLAFTRQMLMLQWSRGVIAAEIRRRRGAHANEEPASMEPRRDRRGDALRGVWRVVGAEASMEPRRDRRGDELVRHLQARGDCVLQWSRGVIAAEIVVDSRYGVVSNMLQWSRGVIAAEIAYEAFCSIGKSWLQWSRGVIAAEIWPRAATLRQKRRFNGAAA